MICIPCIDFLSEGPFTILSNLAITIAASTSPATAANFTRPEIYAATISSESKEGFSQSSHMHHAQSPSVFIRAATMPQLCRNYAAKMPQKCRSDEAPTHSHCAHTRFSSLDCIQ
jgi:hypothetical protein